MEAIENQDLNELDVNDLPEPDIQDLDEADVVGDAAARGAPFLGVPRGHRGELGIAP